MTNIQIISSLIGLAISFFIFYLVRRDHLLTRDGMRWLLVAIAILLVGFFPKVFDNLGSMLGVSYPPIVPVIVGLGVVLIKLLLNDIQRARMKVDIERLVHRVGMLEADLEQEKQSREGSDNQQ